MKRIALSTVVALTIAACSGGDENASPNGNEGPDGGATPIDDAGTSPGSDAPTGPYYFDADGDGVLDEKDNCPKTVNTSQIDLNVNGIGDACDPDLLLVREEVTLKHPGVETGGKRWFLASHANFGTELWRTDGTAAGTAVIDSTVGPPAITTGIVRDMVVAGGKIFTVFQENGGTNKLWAIDPESSLLTPLGTVTYWPGFLSLNGKAYFNAQLGTNASAGVEIAVSDGTVGGTFIVEDMRPGTASFIARLLNATSTQFYFTESDYDANAGYYYWNGLYKSNGSAPATKISSLTDVRHLGQTDQNVYFASFVNYNGGGKSSAQIYRTSAAENSLTQVSSFTGTNRSIGLSSVRAGNAIYFRADDPDITSPLYDPNQQCIHTIADGDAAIAKALCVTNPSSVVPNVLSLYALSATKFLYYVDNSIGGTYLGDLHVYDTTEKTSTPLKQCHAPAPRFVSFAGGYLFDCQKDAEVWFTDGTEVGTTKLFSDPAAKSVAIDTVALARAFFRVTQKDGTYAIWETEGTIAQTKKLFGPTAGGHTLMSVGEHLLISDSKGSLWLH